VQLKTKGIDKYARSIATAENLQTYSLTLYGCTMADPTAIINR